MIDARVIPYVQYVQNKIQVNPRQHVYRCVKLSDTPGKELGNPDEVHSYKVSHTNPRESVFSQVLVWDTALSRGCVPRSSAPEALRSHLVVGHFGEFAE